MAPALYAGAHVRGGAGREPKAGSASARPAMAGRARCTAWSGGGRARQERPAGRASPAS